MWRERGPDAWVPTRIPRGLHWWFSRRPSTVDAILRVGPIGNAISRAPVTSGAIMLSRFHGIFIVCIVTVTGASFPPAGRWCSIWCTLNSVGVLLSLPEIAHQWSIPGFWSNRAANKFPLNELVVERRDETRFSRGKWRHVMKRKLRKITQISENSWEQFKIRNVLVVIFIARCLFVNHQKTNSIVGDKN